MAAVACSPWRLSYILRIGNYTHSVSAIILTPYRQLYLLRVGNRTPLVGYLGRLLVGYGRTPLVGYIGRNSVSTKGVVPLRLFHSLRPSDGCCLISSSAATPLTNVPFANTFIYYNSVPVKMLKSHWRKVRRGRGRFSCAVPVPAGGGFSAWGLPFVFTPRRSNSKSIISRMVSSSCVRSSESVLASSAFRRFFSACISFSVRFITRLLFCCKVKPKSEVSDYSNRTKNYSIRTFCSCPNYSNRTFQVCNSLITKRKP